MANIVEVTVRATPPGGDGWAKIRADAAKAGASAADAFNDAFRLRARASATTRDKLVTTGGIGGDDKSLLNRLKGYANTPGGIGILGTGNDTSLMSMLKNQIRSMGQTGGPGLLSGMGSGGTSTTADLVRETLQNNVTGNVTTQDFIKQVLTGSGPGNVTTSDYIRQVLTGATPGDISTKDVIHPTVDDSDIKDLGRKDADSYSTSFAGELKDKLTGLLSGGGKGGGGSLIGGLLTGGGGSGGAAGALDAGGVAGGALPGIGGVSGMAATVTGLAGALIAVLPAITAVAGGLGVIGGGFALAMMASSKFKNQVTSDLTTLEGIGEKAVQPLIGPLTAGLSSLMGYFKSIAPDLKQLFAAAGPLVQPLVKGFEALMSGAGPGFFAMIKSALPVFQSMSSAFGTLGRDLGAMFSDFASDGSGSATILKAFLDLIGSLLPFIGTLGKIMVSALAPAFAAFSSAISAVLPALTPLVKIIGSFAGAVLTDLAGVLSSIGSLLVDLAPSFTILAKAASQVFSTLENTGVFAILGDALENLAQPIANLINALVRGLAPAIPGIVNLIGQMSSVLITLVSNGLGVLIGALANVIKWLSPVLPLLLEGVVAWKALTIAVGVFNAVMDFNPFAAIALALIAVTALIIKYHTQILAFIEKTWNDVSSFVTGIWDGFLNFARQYWPLLLGVGGVVYKYHEQIWQFIQQIWHNILSFLTGIWGDIKGTVSSAVSSVEGTLSRGWSSVYSTVVNSWNTIVRFFDGIPGRITSAVGSAASVLYNWGKGVINGLLSGMTSVVGSVWNFIKGIPGKILSFLHINSPPKWAIEAGKDIMNGLGIGMSQAQNAANSATQQLQAQVAAVSGGISGAGVSNQSAEMALASAANKMGWGGSQWAALYDVEMREAGFNLTAQNPTSGAYGMAQFINGPSEYAQYGGNASTAAGQAVAMVNYIAQRYGNPQAAWQHELSQGWYDHGGWLPTGASIAYNTTGRPEPVGAAVAGAYSGPPTVVLEITGSGNTTFDAFMLEWVRDKVRVKGGGSVQQAFGRH